MWRLWASMRERALAQQVGRDGLVDVGDDRLHRVEGLAQADDALVRVHVHPQDIGVLLQVDGLDRGYFHGVIGVG